MSPKFANGKICYVEVPALDIQRSADFYSKVFGWDIRRRGDGSTAFDDGAGEVSGTWKIGRPPSREPGLLIYVMVDDVAATIDAVLSNGGQLVQPIGVDAPEITARVSDPAGNVVGLYHQAAVKPATQSASKRETTGRKRAPEAARGARAGRAARRRKTGRKRPKSRGR